VVAVAAVALAALVGIGVLWPTGDAPDLGTRPTTYVDGTVDATAPTVCDDLDVVAPTDCTLVTVDLDDRDGPDSVAQYLVRSTDFATPSVEVGDRVTLLDVAANPDPYRYTFVDFQRSTPMWWLLAAFVVVVLAFGRRQGARALLGLALSGVVLLAFVLPALLRNEHAVLVALCGTVAIAVVALVLAHGANMATAVALAGTLAALAVTTLLAVVAVSAAHLTGLVAEESQILRVTAESLDLRGLLIAGIVIGALGVLDDVTVTQVSTVAALRRADPSMPRRALYREAVHVGRDHVASTVNTLVLAYAGAALPLLLVFAEGDRPIARILTSEVVAVEVVRMLVGSIGLVLSVPITTALAAAILTDEDAVRAHGHAHGHDHTPDPSSDPDAFEPIDHDWDDDESSS